MKISYSWLKEFIDFEQSPAQIADMLVFLGIEASVPACEKPVWKNIITAKVLEVSRHPNADRLSLCSLSDGTNSYSVVCGASNVAQGQVVPLATLGAELPGGIKISKAKIRGVESQGMICSEKELGLKTESSGIMVLADSTPLGKPLVEILGDSDTILEIEIPTNRPDCLSHWGIAREIAGKLRKPLKLPSSTRQNAPPDIQITIENTELCSRYIGRLISDINVGPSPDWIQKRLEKCGLRPINNIVDITNYVLLELGHPLHAFDYDKLAGHKLSARLAKTGETIRALDNKEYKLTDSMLVIADEVKPHAIAGVIGGEDSGVTGNTKNIVLESAVFAPFSVRRTSKALAVSTDSSYRFERGTTQDAAEIASARALSLILELAGGSLKASTDIITKPYVPITIELRPQRVKKLLDMEFSNDETRSSLEALGFELKESNGAFSTKVPFWRLDVKQEIDCVEELARMKGYEHVPTTIMPIVPTTGEGKKNITVEEILRKRLIALGFCEAINYSFCEEKQLEALHMPVTHRIANPLSKENEVLRSGLLSGLWKNFLHNTGKGYEDIKLFESGNIFNQDGEKKSFALIAHGNVWESWWKWKQSSVPKSVDFYFLKGIIENIFSGNEFKIKDNPNAAPYFHPGQCAMIEKGNKTIGEFGMLRPDYNSSAAFAEFDIETLESAWNRETPEYSDLDRFPLVKRDLSVLADKTIAYDNITRAIKSSLKTEKNITSTLQLDDVYEDQQKLGSDKISYTLNFTFRHKEHTLTDTEITSLIDKILIQLNKELNITLRH